MIVTGIFSLALSAGEVSSSRLTSCGLQVRGHAPEPPWASWVSPLVELAGDAEPSPFAEFVFAYRCVLLVHWSVHVSREGGVSPKVELLTKIPERGETVYLNAHLQTGSWTNTLRATKKPSVFLVPGWLQVMWTLQNHRCPGVLVTSQTRLRVTPPPIWVRWCFFSFSAALQLFPSQAVGGAAEAFQSLLRILGAEAALEAVIMAVSLS